MDTNIVGKWGWVSVDEIASKGFEKFINPKHLDSIKHFNLKDHVFKCINIEEGGYLELVSTEVKLILKEEAFRKMPIQPIFKPLDKVKYYNSKGNLEFGIIKNIGWHNNSGKHIYSIEVNGKLKSRRYYDEDLESVEN